MTGHTGDTTLGDRAALALLAYREGRTAPLEDFVHEATPLLWHVVRGQGVPREDAEDVVQGVWLSFVRHTGTIREPEALLAWLLVSARRAAWLAVRRQRGDQAHTRELPDDTDEAGELPSPSPGPEAEVLTHDRDSRLWQVFLRLPARCQQILRFVASADRPDYRAIAEVTGMKVTAVGVTRGRCLAKLRTLLDQDERWEWA
ncbi:sigma-70 family RNA polymerase sigma factor [Actinotalea sp. M2MS4P-6]|uniref:RNA polymerase sigma factor n=1 Tax=Actinotalea sp. M2MS4P-6 TaxID=2983762 RepID=UPI0021E4B6BD|nr:sigma-70 family RNA polymerase sigma factor [Actinotalea sp. M2MS4P-6]MCV2395583.1 sigma-70 family RNA polymerase sigma factor [Actinotalea sp. M2MS4P-6]